jgi:hypothetical protein
MFNVSKMKQQEALAREAGSTHVTLNPRGYRIGAMDDGSMIQEST